MLRLAFDQRSALRLMQSTWFSGIRDLLGGRAWEILHHCWILRRELGTKSALELSALLGYSGDADRLVEVLVEFGVMRQVRGRWVLNAQVPETPPAVVRPTAGHEVDAVSSRPTPDWRVMYGAVCQQIRRVQQRLEDVDEEYRGELRSRLQQLHALRDRIQCQQIGLDRV